MATESLLNRVLSMQVLFYQFRQARIFMNPLSDLNSNKWQKEKIVGSVFNRQHNHVCPKTTLYYLYLSNAPFPFCVFVQFTKLCGNMQVMFTLCIMINIECFQFEYFDIRLMHKYRLIIIISKIVYPSCIIRSSFKSRYLPKKK